MAKPSYVQASAGATDASGAFTFTGPASGTIGNLVILQILVDGTGAIDWGTLSATNINAIDGTANTWTLVGTFNIGSAAVAQMRLYMGRRTSSSSAPTFTTTANTSGNDVYGRMYEYTNVSTGTTLATVIENATAGSTSSSAGTNATVADASVQTLGVDRLSLNFVGINDDNITAGFDNQSGGAWQVAISGYHESGGTDASIVSYYAEVTSDVASRITDNSFTRFDVEGGDGVGADEAQAQSFTVPAARTLQAVEIRLTKSGSPADNFVVEVRETSQTGTLVASASLSGGSVSTAIENTLIPISASLSSGTTYFLVFTRDGARDTANYYQVAGPNTANYANGTRSTRATGAWSDQADDLSFALDFGGSFTGATIDGGTFTQADGTDGWGSVGFALIGTTVSTPFIARPINTELQSVTRASLW